MLKRRRPKLAGVSSRDLKPEPLGRLGVSVLVDVNAQYPVVSVDPGNIQKEKKKPDQPWVAVDEHHSVGLAVWLTLCALAPVGNGARNEHVPCGELPDLGGCGLGLRSMVG
jgi:hypothetical protein